MEMSFRWYGSDDPVKLEDIRQIPQMKGIVSAIYDIPAGEVWPYDEIVKLRDAVGGTRHAPERHRIRARP